MSSVKYQDGTRNGDTADQQVGWVRSRENVNLMIVESTVALVKLRALVAGGAALDTPEARRAANIAVAGIKDERRKNLILSLIEGSFTMIENARTVGSGEEQARLDLMLTLSVLESVLREP